MINTNASLLVAGLSCCVVTNIVAEPLVTDYKSATSSYEEAYVTGNFNAQNNGTQDKLSYDIDLAVAYEKVFSSPDANTTMQLDGTGERSRGGTTGDATISNYQVLGSVSKDTYLEPNSKGVFFYGKGEVGLRKGQESAYAAVTIGGGYGRVVNVTPMARTIRLFQELRMRGDITADPATVVYQKVAELIAKENEYRSRHGAADYREIWLEDIDVILKDSGNTPGDRGLGVRALIKSFDILTNERISARKYGWLVRAGGGFVLSDYDGDNGDPLVEVGFEYHYPLGNTTQFSEEAIAKTILNDNNDIIFTNNLSLTHEISDRIDWENSLLSEFASNEGIPDESTHTLTSSFRYYLSNQLDFKVSASASFYEDGIDDNANDDVSTSLDMGITYRLK